MKDGKTMSILAKNGKLKAISSQLKNQIQSAMYDLDPHTIELVKSTPGIGKTYQAEAVAVEKARLGQTTIFAMQSNKRAQQESEAMKSRFGYQAAVISGRNSDNCANFELAKALGQTGHGVRNVLCEVCQYRRTCTESYYLSQFDSFPTEETKVAFMPYESAINFLDANQNNSRLNADLLVFDENPDRVILQKHSLTSQQLENITVSSSNVKVVIDLLLALIGSVQISQDVLSDWLPLNKNIQRILDDFQSKGDIHAQLAINSQHVFSAAIDDIGQLSNELRGLIRLMPKLNSKFVFYNCPGWFSVIVAELKRIMMASDEINTSLVVTTTGFVFKQRRVINMTTKMIILDAYGRAELYQQAFSRKVRTHKLEVKPDWQVYFAPINTSKGRLKDVRSGRWTDEKWTQMLKSFTRLFRFERMVIFTDKYFQRKVKRILDSIQLSERVNVDYFYRGRGINEYQDFDAVLVIGQAEIRGDIMVSEARALYSDNEYISQLVKSSNKREFRDHRLQQYKESKQIDEIIQSVYRIRPATHKHPLGKKVIICTGFEIKGLTDQSNVIRLGGNNQCYTKSLKLEIRRSYLCGQVKSYISKFGYLTLAKGLTDRLDKIMSRSQSERDFLTFAHNNIQNNSFLSESEKVSYIKDFSVSEKTIRKDLKVLVKNGQIQSHRVSIKLDGNRYPVVVYGSLDAFQAEIGQAEAAVANYSSLK